MKFYGWAWRVVLLALLFWAHREHKYLAAELGLAVFQLKIVINFLEFAISTSLLTELAILYYKRKERLAPGHSNNVVAGIRNLYLLILAGAVISYSLALAGIDWATLFTTVSIVAAAIALLTKEYIAEIVSGLLISFSRFVEIGDTVKIGELRGKVTELTLSKTALLTDDDEVIYVPNTKVWNSEVINYSELEHRRSSVEFELDVNHLESVDLLEKDLTEILKGFSEYVDFTSIVLRTLSIKKDAVQFKFQYQLNIGDRELERTIRRKINRRIVDFIIKLTP